MDESSHRTKATDYLLQTAHETLCVKNGAKCIIHIMQCQEKIMRFQVSPRRAHSPDKVVGSLNDRFVLHGISGQELLADERALAIGSGGIPTQGQRLQFSQMHLLDALC